MIKNKALNNKDIQRLLALLDNKCCGTDSDITIIPQYANNTAALAGGLLPGQLYHLPYNSGSDLMSVQVVNAPPAPDLPLKIVFNGDNTLQRNIYFISQPNSHGSVDWGDGSPIEDMFFSSYPYHTATHTYADNNEYTALFYPPAGDSFYNIQAASQKIKSVTQIETSLENCSTYELNNNNLTSQNINYLLDYNYGNNEGNMNLSGQTPSAPPTGSGIITKQNLIDDGASIITD